MHVRLLPIALLLLLVLASIVRADPFNVDLRKAEARIAALKAQAKTRIDPNRSLEWRLPECNFAAIPLKDVLDFLHDTSGVEILTDWHALTAVGIDHNAPVTAKRREVKVRDLLAEILISSGADQRGVRFEMVDELIVISTLERLTHMKRLVAALKPPLTPAPGNPTATADPLDARVIAVGVDPCLGDVLGLVLRGPTLQEALDELSANANVAIRADWAALRPLAIARDTQIGVRVPNTSLRCALLVLFTELGPLELLDWRAAEGGVTIGSTLPR